MLKIFQNGHDQILTRGRVGPGIGVKGVIGAQKLDSVHRSIIGALIQDLNFFRFKNFKFFYENFQNRFPHKEVMMARKEVKELPIDFERRCYVDKRAPE